MSLLALAGLIPQPTNYPARPHSSDPRGCGLSLIGPASGYPKVWVNSTGENIQITDTINTLIVSPGGKIQQMGNPTKGKIVPMQGAVSANPGGGTAVPSLMPTLPVNAGQAKNSVQASGISTQALILGAVLLFILARSQKAGK